MNKRSILFETIITVVIFVVAVIITLSGSH